jgi:hypothetical protein
MYRLVPIVAGYEPNLMLTHDLLACDIDEAPEFRWQNPTGTVLRSVSFPFSSFR